MSKELTKEIRNVKLFKGQGKNSEFLEAFEKLPKEKELKDFIKQHYGHGFYHITYHDGVKPQKKVYVVDRIGSSKVESGGSFNLPRQTDQNSELLFELLNTEVRHIKGELADIRTSLNLAIEILKNAVEEVEDVKEDAEEDNSALSTILSKMEL